MSDADARFGQFFGPSDEEKREKEKERAKSQALVLHCVSKYFVSEEEADPQAWAFLGALL